MKKIFFVLILILGFEISANAQLVIALLFGDKLYTPKTELGLNVGGNLSSATKIPNATYESQLGIGMYFKWKFSENWQLQPEVFFRYPQGGRKLPPYDIDDPNLDPIIDNSTLIRQSQYFSLPIKVNYRIWKELRFSLGPQVSYLYSNQDIFHLTMESGEDVYIRRRGIGNLKKFDFGGVAGVCYTLRNGKGVTLAAGGYYGLISPDPNFNNSDAVNYNLNFYVGIPIGVGKDKVDELSTN